MLPAGIAPASFELEARHASLLRHGSGKDARASLALARICFADRRFDCFTLRAAKWCAVCELHTARGNLARSTGEPASLTVYRRDWLRGLELHQVSQAYETRRDSDPPRQMEPISSYALDCAIYRTALARFANRQKVVALEGFAPSRAMVLVPKTSVSSDSTIGP
jgi:hypothetical protein